MVKTFLEKHLPYGFFSNAQANGSWVNYKYERLPPNFCYTCGRIGHQQGTCEFKQEWKKGRYGDHTRAGPHSPAAPTPQRPTPNFSESTPRPTRHQTGGSEQSEPIAAFWGALRGSVSRAREREGEAGEEPRQPPPPGFEGVQARDPSSQREGDQIPQNLLGRFDHAAQGTTTRRLGKEAMDLQEEQAQQPLFYNEPTFSAMSP
ncbi:hypothetical protein LINGRAHAP2_LOCUS30929 [Linum grandiflorum]